MSQSNSSIPNNSDLTENFSTNHSLHHFLKTIKTIQDILNLDPVKAKEEPFSQITELLSNEECGLREVIQQVEQSLEKEAPNLDRDTGYINSPWYRWELSIDRLRERLGFSEL